MLAILAVQTEIKCVQCAGTLRKETFHGFQTQVIKRGSSELEDLVSVIVLVTFLSFR